MPQKRQPSQKQTKELQKRQQQQQQANKQLDQQQAQKQRSKQSTSTDKPRYARARPFYILHFREVLREHHEGQFRYEPQAWAQYEQQLQAQAKQPTVMKAVTTVGLSAATSGGSRSAAATSTERPLSAPLSGQSGGGGGAVAGVPNALLPVRTFVSNDSLQLASPTSDVARKQQSTASSKQPLVQLPAAKTEVSGGKHISLLYDKASLRDKTVGAAPIAAATLGRVRLSPSRLAAIKASKLPLAPAYERFIVLSQGGRSAESNKSAPSLAQTPPAEVGSNSASADQVTPTVNPLMASELRKQLMAQDWSQAKTVSGSSPTTTTQKTAKAAARQQTPSAFRTLKAAKGETDKDGGAIKSVMSGLAAFSDYDHIYHAVSKTSSGSLRERTQKQQQQQQQGPPQPMPIQLAASKKTSAAKKTAPAKHETSARYTDADDDG